jgi:hypothetical protein
MDKLRAYHLAQAGSGGNREARNGPLENAQQPVA